MWHRSKSMPLFPQKQSGRRSGILRHSVGVIHSAMNTPNVGIAVTRRRRRSRRAIAVGRMDKAEREAGLAFNKAYTQQRFTWPPRSCAGKPPAWLRSLMIAPPRTHMPMGGAVPLLDVSPSSAPSCAALAVPSKTCFAAAQRLPFGKSRPLTLRLSSVLLFNRL